MPQKIQALIKANREGTIILTAAIITLLLFVYSSFVNLNLAISNLADALIGCGILASMFWGWHLSNSTLQIDGGCCGSGGCQKRYFCPVKARLCSKKDAPSEI